VSEQFSQVELYESCDFLTLRRPGIDSTSARIRWPEFSSDAGRIRRYGRGIFEVIVRACTGDGIRLQGLPDR
jgi:hypothetical protein